MVVTAKAPQSRLRSPGEAWNSFPALARSYASHERFASDYRVAYGDSAAKVIDRFRELNAKSAAALVDGQQSLLAMHGKRSNVERRDETLALFIYGGIVDSSRQFADAITSHRCARRIVVYIDTPGGLLGVAHAIYDALLDHPARKVAVVDRSCWSAGVLIAAACDRIICRNNSTMMVHRARSVSEGTADDHHIAMLQARHRDDQYMRCVLARRRRVSPQKFEQLRADERFMTAIEAVHSGFADRVVPSS